MLEDVRRNVLGFVEAGMAAMSGKLTPTKARDMARSLVAGEGPKQVNKVAQELVDWSQRSREWITEAVSREVRRQLSTVGIATKEDLDALRKRVRELERGRSPSGARKAPAKKGSAPAAEEAAREPVRQAPGLGDPGAAP